jgi:hypothetical protein
LKSTLKLRKKKRRRKPNCGKDQSLAATAKEDKEAERESRECPIGKYQES